MAMEQHAGPARQWSAWTDEEVLEAVRHDDPAAFAEIYLRYSAEARRFASRLVPPSDVEDVVSEAFTKVLRAISADKGPVDKALPYLMVAVRTTASTLHTRRIRAEEMVRRSAVPQLVEPEPGLDDEVLALAFRSLSSRWRQVIWWSDVEGRNPHEIGELLGLSASAASALAYRARRALRLAYLEASATRPE